MLLELSSDQEFFRETTERFLREQVPVTELRRLRHDPAGFDREYWRRGADLGWTSLLVSEDHGGGTISGKGVVDLSLIAYEFGRHAAPGPLAVANVVAATLSETGVQPEVLQELVSGTSIASWSSNDSPPLNVAREGNTLVVNGVTRPVESAAQADHLLVTGYTGDGLVQLLIPTDAPGVSDRPMRTVDLTRRFSVVTLDDVRLSADAVVGDAGQTAQLLDRQRQLALATANAESVGAMQAVFDMAFEWAFDRYSFGRPLASYQEIKHRFADMKSWLEAGHAISDAAAAAVAARSPGANELVSVAKAFIGAYGTELVQDCLQIHGGIGITFDHDLHLFLRRVTVNRALYGTPADHRQRIATIVEQREGAA
jgi:alkylation response protein AidB-like acyl-CoA dehydrogenase